MSLISNVGKKSWSQRIFVSSLYGVLTVFGTTMVIPFMMTLSGSASNAFDYDRFSVAPRALFSKEDRFVKGIVDFVNLYPHWSSVLGEFFPSAPENWTTWSVIGDDHDGIDRLARPYLHPEPGQMALWRRQAADYCEFAAGYPIDDTLCDVESQKAARFTLERYEGLLREENPKAAGALGEASRRQAALDLLSRRWDVPVPSFFSINYSGWIGSPLEQQSWAPVLGSRLDDYNALRDALRHGWGTPGVERDWVRFLHGKGYTAREARKFAPPTAGSPPEVEALWVEFARDNAPASPVIPFPMRTVWLDFLRGEAVRDLVHIPAGKIFDVDLYNSLAGTRYASLNETPFPLPAQGFAGLRPLWTKFIQDRYPLRLLKLDATPALLDRYHAYLRHYPGVQNPGVENLNALMGTSYHDWSEFPLEATIPRMQGSNDTAGDNRRKVWVGFAGTLAPQERAYSSSEAVYHQFLLARYGSLEAVNAAYGWHLGTIEEAQPPFDKAYAVTYLNHSSAFAWEPVLANYGTVCRFLLYQSNALPVTLWLIFLSILVTLTVNPIAGYALSRFKMRGKDKIILFCLATATFPAMVSAIPGYLLVRDLGMLNTFAALIIPGAASGMSIFIYKGFFDSLPQELYEAATMDGAREWQIFGYVTLPMIKPIMAINALNAFLGAYSGWEWAIIICQDKKMWTISVWLYQVSQTWANTPWITTAGFIVISIPILIAFLFCQNIIMKGIIVPSMK